MNPVPMTAAPMSERRAMLGAAPPARASCLDDLDASTGERPHQPYGRGSSTLQGRRRLRLPTIILSSVKDKSPRFRAIRGVSSGAMDGEHEPGAIGRGPLPDEALDALVIVLDELRLGRSRSRSDLVARTGLGRAIVARRVGELIDRGLLAEADVGPSTGGRPPRQLAFRADAGHVLVADLGATSIDVAITGLDGRILAHHDEPARIEDGPAACLDRVDDLFD